MVTATEKARVRMKLDGRCASHSRTEVSVRGSGSDVKDVWSVRKS